MRPDGPFPLPGTEPSSYGIWRRRALRTLRGHSEWIDRIAVDGDWRRAVSASEDQTLKVWDLKTGRPLRTLRGHSDKVTDVALSPDGRLAVSASWDGTLKLWDLDTGDVAGRTSPPTRTCSAVPSPAPIRYWPAIAPVTSTGSSSRASVLSRKSVHRVAQPCQELYRHPPSRQRAWGLYSAGPDKPASSSPTPLTAMKLPRRTQRWVISGE